MNETLRKLQHTQLEILRVIDSFCRTEKIKYSLYAGTLLGAVRHQGFIPWDDDLDICMERSEYNRFIAAWSQRGPTGYLLQNKENTPSFTQSFTKIRKDHTTFLQYEWEKNLYHTGIYVDVFPVDRIPSSMLRRVLFQWRCLKYQLLTREFVPPNGSIAEKAVAKLVLSAVPPEKRNVWRERLLERITVCNDKRFHTIAIETKSTIQTPLPADLLENYTELLFEDRQYSCFAGWDEYLRIKFGDYMVLPPENERTWRHHPLVLDFDHNLEEIG